MPARFGKLNAPPMQNIANGDTAARAGLGCSMGWCVEKPQEVAGFQSEARIGAAIVVAEFHFEDLGSEYFDYGAHLSADQPRFGQVPHQSDNRE